VTSGTSTAALVEYAIGTPAAAIPSAVLRMTRDILLDTIGAMLGACAPRHTTARLTTAYARAEGGAPRATVVGQGLRTGPSLAALVNATLAYALDVEGLHGPSITHAAAVVVPTALAAAELRGRDGAALLAAIVTGLDVADRISRAITPRALYARGFHPSAIAGAPAAALAAANLMGLDAAGARRALGLAATQASGLMSWESDPSENARPFNCGIAARNGITSALLAELGFGGPEDALEGEAGLLEAFGDSSSSASVLGDSLGERFAVTETLLKRFACCGFLQSGVEALLQLRDRASVRPDDVACVTLHFPSSGASVIDGNPLRSHSAQYVLAVALARGDVTFDDIADDWRPRDPAIAALSSRVRLVHSVELDAQFPARYPSRVELALVDGRHLIADVYQPTGHPSKPLSQAALRDKFSKLVAPVASETTTQAIIAAVDGLQSSPSVEPLMQLLGNRNPGQADGASGREAAGGA
jgi:2-methylcitrate dehydratase PrpD